MKLFFLASLLWISLVSAQELIIINDEYPPYVYKDNGLKGVYYEVTMLALMRAGYQPQLHIKTWETCLDEVFSGQADAIMTIYHTEERTQFITYSEPVFISELMFFWHKDTSFEYTGLSSLKNYKLGITKGYYYSQEFQEADYLNKKEYLLDASQLYDIYRKVLDIAILDKQVVSYYTSTIYTECKSEIDYMKPAYVKKPLFFAVSKKNPLHIGNYQKF